MKHSGAEDTVHELAALYALGVLDEAEAKAFEAHLADGCDVCSTDVSAYESIVANLAFVTESETPSEGARERLSARVASEGSEIKGGREGVLSSPGKMRSTRTEELEWHEVNAGILIKRLSVDEATGLATSLVKMLPGRRLARHRHNGSEQLFILEGDCHLQGEVLGPGDYHRAEDGSIHDTTYTVGGTTFLLIAPVTYEFLE
ncbi:MAG TPA: cupin domain-containing protein [Blastocatellia bacterium]|nr:cupin domain-containing protein [Blastocatellia bacterium]